MVQVWNIPWEDCYAYLHGYCLHHYDCASWIDFAPIRKGFASSEAESNCEELLDQKNR